MIKKTLLTLLILASTTFAVLLPTAPVAAVNVFGTCNSTAANTAVCQDAKHPSTSNPVVTGFKLTLNIVSFIVGVAAVFVIILAGLRMITQSDDANAIQAARSAIIYALVGLIVVALSQVMVIFVLNKLT